MKTAAIWWRVSTDEQREISPVTQTGEALALALAEQEGYSVPPENVIGTDWSSLSYGTVLPWASSRPWYWTGP